MKKLLYSALALTVFFGCVSVQVQDSGNGNTSVVTNPSASLESFMQGITPEELKEHLYIFASDDFAGREAGEAGEKKAQQYLKRYYEAQNIKSPMGDGDYFQVIPAGTFKQVKNQSENVLAFIPGTDLAEEVLVLSAHYDHVGSEGGKVFNGADDDGSGTVAVLEIAEAFREAQKAGKGPRRSILFLHVTAEEKGLLGSKYYSENPVFPLANTIANLNIDMIGRQDAEHADDDNYVYLIGSDKLSTDLHNISEAANSEFINMNLDYRFRENDPNRFYYRSDHYNFAKHNIPIIFYFNGVHEDYHQATDTPEKINYDLLAKRAQLIFATAWKLANRDARPVVDKVDKG